jgi:hypothetical protein
MEREYLLICIYIYNSWDTCQAFGITGIKSRVGISKNTIDPCCARIGIFQNARPAYTGE